jgi:hypothetical protein
MAAGLLELKRFVGRFRFSSDTRFFLVDDDFSLTKDGTGTFCLLALDVRYSRMRTVGLYFLAANLKSAAEMSLLSSPRSNAPSASVMGFHLSFACAKIACSKSVISAVISAVIHLLTCCRSTALRSSS